MTPVRLRPILAVLVLFVVACGTSDPTSAGAGVHKVIERKSERPDVKDNELTSKPASSRSLHFNDKAGEGGIGVKASKLEKRAPGSASAASAADAK